MTDQPLDERLKAYEGKEAGGPDVGADPVNVPMIRHWCEAMGDENPVYLDEAAAARSVHSGIVAPPTMLQAWVMRGIRGRPATGGSLLDELYRQLDAEGYTSVVATNCEQEYHREVRPGDHLSTTAIIESVSDEKKTALGVGRFVTNRITYTDQHGEPVADMRFRILKFKPPAKKEAAAEKPLRPRPALTQDNAFFLEGAKAGKLLIQRCASCGKLRHPPRPVCPHCRSLEWDTVESSGRGIVYSYVVNHHPQIPAFDYPLPVGLIELDEGTRLVSDLVGIDAADVKVGMPVQAEFLKCDDDLTVPVFRPVA